MVSSFSATMISSFSATMITITRPGPQSEVMSDAHGPNREAACLRLNHELRVHRHEANVTPVGNVGRAVTKA